MKNTRQASMVFQRLCSLLLFAFVVHSFSGQFVQGDLLAAVGTRTQESIMEVVLSGVPDIKKTYNSYLKKDPSLSGLAVMRFKIDCTGHVVSCEAINARTTIANEAFLNDIAKEISSWQFGSIRSPSSVVVEYPFRFSPSNAAPNTEIDKSIPNGPSTLLGTLAIVSLIVLAVLKIGG